MLTTFLLTLSIFALVIGGMALGTIVQNKPLKGSCGGLNAIGIEGDCGGACGRDLKECKYRKQDQ